MSSCLMVLSFLVFLGVGVAGFRGFTGSMVGVCVRC